MLFSRLCVYLHFPSHRNASSVSRADCSINTPSTATSHRGERFCVCLRFFRFHPLVGFLWSFRFLKSNDMFFEVSCPMCVCYFWNFVNRVSLYLCVRCLPEGMFAQRGVLLHCRLFLLLVFFFLWCEEQVRDEKRESTSCPPCSHTSTESHPDEHTNVRPTVGDGGEPASANTVQRILQCMRIRKKNACGEHSLEQNAQSCNSFKSFGFPVMPVCCELRIREICKR